MLIAFVFALAATMPVGARAMPVAAMNTAGTMLQQHCPGCLQHPETNHTQPDRMLACTMLACAGSVIMQPSQILTPEPTFRQVAYAKTPANHWATLAPAPDPFPPRPIVLL